jgi:hypothetical protein
MTVLSDHFPEWFGYWLFWLPYFPDLLNPCSYFLWGFRKDSFKNNVHTIEEMKQEVLAAMISVSKDTFAEAV